MATGKKGPPQKRVATGDRRRRVAKVINEESTTVNVETIKDAVNEVAGVAANATTAAAETAAAAIGAGSADAQGGTAAGGGDKNVLRGAVGATSKIVQQAASILEEEIAAGIVAAKKVEARLLDVQKLRGADSQEVMQRFRRDAHEVVDILIDLVNVATNSLSGVAQRVIRISEAGVGAAAGGAAASGGKLRPAGSAVPSLAVSQPLKPGESVAVPLTLENDGDTTTENFRFLCSDLVNASGDRIAGGHVSFAPEALVIGPHSAATVTVTVNAPPGTPAGVYSGIVQATKLEQLRAVLSVHIEQ